MQLREKINRAIEVLKHADPKIQESGIAEIILAAIEKEIPQKPMRREGWPDAGRDTVIGYCPRCSMNNICVTPRYYAVHPYYCRNCGQRIDWSVTE